MPECTLPGCARPTDPAAYACADCASRLHERLSAAADLVPELDTTLARQTRYGDPGPRPRNSAPAEPVRLGLSADPATDHQSGPAGGLPFSEAASIVGGTVANTVSTWLRLVVAERFPGPAPAGPVCLECEHPSCERLHAWRRWMPPPTGLAAAMRWLAGQVEWMRHQRWVAEAVDELEHAAGLVARAVDRPVERVDAGLCLAVLGSGEKCQRRLSAVPGAANVRCPDCGATHDTAARRELLLRQARDMRGSATEMARWLTLLGLPTPADTVHKWVRRGRLPADGFGRYAFRDAEALRARESRSAA